MIRTLSLLTWLVVAVGPQSAAAQTRLTLADAITLARSHNVDARSAESAERQAVQRVAQARAGYLPNVDVSEAWQRGNQPVFVFSSLLAQRRFAASNFGIDALNHPDAMGNIRTAITVDQAVFDPTTRPGVRAATLGLEIAAAGRAILGQDLAVMVSGAYGAVLTAEAARTAATAAAETAKADLELARNRRDAGMVTDADVLQLDVALARMRANAIRAGADATIARARLNQAIGEPLDAVFDLEDPPDSAPVADSALATLETSALAERPDIKLVALQEQLAAAAVDSAHAAYLPRVAVQAGWEANGGSWDSRASSWTIGAIGHVNLFRGFADRARVAEAREQQSQRALEREKAATVARLEVRAAVARLTAARAAEAVGRAAAAQARESHRIIRDRYEGGLAAVSALLRAAEEVQQADARQTGARVDVMLAAAELNRAVGKR